MGGRSASTSSPLRCYRPLGGGLGTLSEVASSKHFGAALGVFEVKCHRGTPFPLLDPRVTGRVGDLRGSTGADPAGCRVVEVHIGAGRRPPAPLHGERRGSVLLGGASLERRRRNVGGLRGRCALPPGENVRDRRAVRTFFKVIRCRGTSCASAAGGEETPQGGLRAFGLGDRSSCSITSERLPAREFGPDWCPLGGTAGPGFSGCGRDLSPGVALWNAAERSRTSTALAGHKALNLARLPVPPQPLEGPAIVDAVGRSAPRSPGVLHPSAGRSTMYEHMFCSSTEGATGPWT